MAEMGQSAVIYTRVSSDRQVENASLETQERACRAYCEKNGWRFYEFSEKKANQPRPLTDRNSSRLYPSAVRIRFVQGTSSCTQLIDWPETHTITVTSEKTF